MNLSPKRSITEGVRATLFPEEKATEIERISRHIAENKKNGSRTFYARLPLEDSVLIRQHYADQLMLPLAGIAGVKFFTPAGTHIATGYTRIVIGDYGAYAEFLPEQIFLDKIEPLFLDSPKRPVKYIWLRSKDSARIKIYEQKRRVSYADYKPGFYYIDPQDLHTETIRELYKS